MKQLIVLLFLSVSFFAGGTVPKAHIFAFSKNEFLLDGQPFQIISGEIHPARVPQMYWRNRIQMAKAMGCNTIAAYVFWNYLEETPGHFDFTTENRNIAQFIRICQEEGMWVLLRPGPYVCAEIDFGGLPSYLLKIPDIKIRCMDNRYMEAVKRYVMALSEQVKPLQCTAGGPILMVQVENEYGSYGNDRRYLNTLADLWRKNGIDVPFYIADGPAPYMLEAGTVEGAAVGLDSGTSNANFEEATKINPNVPSFSSETYPGWLTHWKEKFARTDTTELLKDIRYLLDHKKSFNFYVVHGGTNFGFSAGANSGARTQFQPDITSYDYDAPINEQGQPTPKYFALRRLIQKYVSYKLPAVPPAPKVMEIPGFTMQRFTSIWNNLPKPVYSPQPQPMEMYNQANGLILYRTKLVGHKSGTLTIQEPHDFALVFLNGQLVDSVYRDGGKWTVKLPKTDVQTPELDILVESMGHINFAQNMIDRKGITDRVTLNGMTLMDWQVYSLPLQDSFIKTLTVQKDSMHNGIFFKGEVSIDHPYDTYIDVSRYSKGVVWVNGHNLGRYWNVGPQKHLYCPACFLTKGRNTVVILDLLQAEAQPVQGVKTLE